MATQKVAYRFLYVLIFTLFVLTCYFFILDLQGQTTNQPTGLVDPDFRPTRSSIRSQINSVSPDRVREFPSSEQGSSQEKEKVAMPSECPASEAQLLVGTAVSFVRRYIDSYTYDQPREQFHPKDAYLLEAEKELQEGFALCDWSTCPDLCVNASVYSALLSLKKDRPYEASNVLDVGLTFAKTPAQRGKLKVFKGFVAEYADQLRPKGYLYYNEAIREWPDAASEYIAIIRYDLPDDAPREEKMKIYYYGKREATLALVDGLLAKEFYPENLKSYPILRHDEPALFWNPPGAKQYKLIKQLMSPFIQSVNAKMMASLIDNGHLDFKDPQATRFFAYNERFSRFFQYNSADTIRKILGRPVIVSYTYFGGYVGGSTLDPHRDRPACEYTMSLCIDHFPHGSTWALGINKISKENVTPRDMGGPGVIPPEENIVWAHLQPGDAFIFQGRHKVHWRDGELPNGHFSRVYFYHYVNEDYVGSLT